MSEAAPAPAATPAPSATPAPAGAVVSEQGPLNVDQTRAAYSDAVARGIMSREAADRELATAGAQPVAAAASARADAQASIDRIMQGKDPAFSAAYTDPKNPGHADARAKMSAWQAAAKGGADGQPAAQQGAAPAASVPLSLIHDSSATPGEIVEANKVGNEAIAAMGIDPEAARSLVSTLSNSIRNRMTLGEDGKNVGKPMSAAEMVSLDGMLKKQWGEQGDTRAALAKKAIASAGKHAPWLRQSIQMSDPTTAAIMLDSLARHGEKMGARR